MTPFTLDVVETGSLRKPSASQRFECACAVDLWGGRTMKVFQLFNQQRDRYEQSIADEQRKSDTAIHQARRDAAHYQNQLNLLGVMSE